MVYQLNDPAPLSNEATPQTPVPDYTLFDSTSVTIAAILGGPIPGTLLMAHNYRRLGQKDDAVTAVVLGVLALGAAIGVGYIVPQGSSAVISILLAVGIRRAAEALQGPAVDHHVNQGGRLASRWWATGMGMVFLAIFSAVILVPIFMRGPKIEVDAGEIYYNGSATKAEATALGDQLKTVMNFGSRGSTVTLAKGKQGTVLGFVVHEGAWDKPETAAAFQEIGRQVAPAIGGFPIKVQLLNSSRDVKKEFRVGKVVFDKDNIYYFGSATDSDAQALGTSLKSVGYFHGQGSSVMLSKDNDGTAISFVVKQGSWNDPAIVAYFEKAVHDSALSVGGLPVKLRLVNATLELEKEETVN